MTDPIYAWVEDGIVTNITEWDGNADPMTGGLVVPEGVAMAPIPDGAIAYIGFGATQNSDGSWVFDQPPPPTRSAEEILAANTAERVRLLNASSMAISTLQDAIDLGMQEDGDAAMLTAWRAFRVNVTRVDLTSATPAWPTPPEAGYGAVVTSPESDS